MHTGRRGGLAALAALAAVLTAGATPAAAGYTPPKNNQPGSAQQGNPWDGLIHAGQQFLNGTRQFLHGVTDSVQNAGRNLYWSNPQRLLDHPRQVLDHQFDTRDQLRQVITHPVQAVTDQIDAFKSNPPYTAGQWAIPALTTLGGLAGYLLPETTGGTTAAGVTAVENAATTVTVPATDGVRPLVYDTGQQPLYRGSSTPPEVVSEQGFPAKGSDPDLVAHLTGSTQSAYRSASRSSTVSGRYAISNLNGRGWCYLICKSGGVDVNATLAGNRLLPAFAPDQEVAFPGAIEPEAIAGGWRVTEDPMGNPVFHEYVPNPGFDPTRSPIRLPTNLTLPPDQTGR